MTHNDNTLYLENLTQRAQELARVTGQPEKLCRQYLRREDYRAEYNKRPDVIEARKAYRQRQGEQLKALRQLVKRDPEILNR